jgi:hypothetical protein
MRILSRTTVALVAFTSTAALVATAVPATAGSKYPPRETTLAENVAAPFQIALSRGHVYYSDGFAGTVSKVSPGADKVVASVPGGEIAGVEFSTDGKTMAFASTTETGATLTIRRHGKRDVVANLGRYEEKKNPDRKVTYGIVKNGNKCAADFLAGATQQPATYKGIVESHPYQVMYLGRGAWAVADAAANAILRVNKWGHISTMAVLPRQPIKFTAAHVAALGAPDCVKNVVYAFEPVPTDVERTRHGKLLVSTLPGGPEGPALGGRGSVYKVWPSGYSRRVATGFLGATNLAVDRAGTIFVTELFNNRISKVSKWGKVSKALTVERPAAVEAHGKYLYVGVMTDFETGAPGRVVRIRR